MTTLEIEKLDKFSKTGECDNDCMAMCPLFFECIYQMNGKDYLKEKAKDKLLEIKIKMI